MFHDNVKSEESHEFGRALLIYHSLLPCSLDRRCFMFIVPPKEVVGCRGGNQNVDGGSPYFRLINIG